MEFAPTTGLEIAVIGMAGRFPGAPDLGAFWDNLVAGRESISSFSPEQLQAAGIDETLYTNPNYVPARGILGYADRFDAGFFGYSPKEAAIMDPQHRMFLETAWRAMENAGYLGRRYNGNVGVYASVGFNSYLVMSLEMNPRFMQGEDGTLAMLSNDKDFLATRVSYKLGLTGPSVVVQSACSSSLAAVHHACQSLLAGEADIQLAGGVTIRVPEYSGYLYQEGMINSPDGHCRPFDKDAAGTVAGNGVGVVVLKRLEDALRDRDHIYAVVRASAINNDGTDKVGYAAPSTKGQTRAIRAALALSELPAESIGFIETHGSGTRMGDPIELEALRNAYDFPPDKRACCALGAVKANIGHLDSAAGIAGFIKTVLTLHKGVIPPHPTFREANPLCHLASGPFYVATSPRQWETAGHSRRAGVSSFGMGGTNVHIILEQAPPPSPSTPSSSWQLLPLSARTLKSLDRQKENLRQDLQRHNQSPLADIAYTLQTGREHFQHNYFLLARSTEQAADILSMGLSKLTSGTLWDGEERQVVFMFPGQGAQFAGMGRTLYEEQPVFHAELDACEKLLQSHFGWSLTEHLFDQGEQADGLLNRTRFTQPALFTVELALARLFMHWGIQPHALVGHSVGEYVAAVLAGIMSRDDALLLVAERGRLIDSLPGGDMLFVPQSEEQLQPLLGDGVELAVLNAPAASVLSGPTEAVGAVQKRLEEQGVKVRLLRTSHAFHSGMMEPILEEFEQRVWRVELSAPQLPILSNRTGSWMSAAQATDPGYWAAHLRHSVRFFQCVETLAESTPKLFLELGPGNGLASFCQETLGLESRHQIVSAMPRPDPEHDDHSQALFALGQLWQQGIMPDWERLHEQGARNRLPLASYPFNGGSYWVDTAIKLHTRALSPHQPHPLRTRIWTPQPDLLLPAERPQHLLALHADQAVMRGILRRLSAQGITCLRCITGKKFKPLKDGGYSLPYGKEDNYRQLFEACNPNPATGLDILMQYPTGYTLDERLGGFLELLKAMARFSSTTGCRIRFTLLLPTSHAVIGSEPDNWERQAATTMAWILGDLQPTITWRMLDAGVLLDKVPLWKRRHPQQEPSAHAALLLEDLSGFSPNTCTAYRNGLRWRLQEQALEIRTVEPVRDTNYIITGSLTPSSADLLCHWHTQWGGKFIYVPPPAEAHQEQRQSNQAIIDDLKSEGLPVSVCRSEALIFLIPKLRRTAPEKPLHLWYFNTMPAESEDEVLIYLERKDLNEICAGGPKLLNSLESIAVDERVWISTLPAFYRYPPHLMQILLEAPLAGARNKWRSVHLPEDLFNQHSPYADLGETRLRELLAQALYGQAGGWEILLSLLPSEDCQWNRQHTQSPATENEEESGTEQNTDSYARPDLPTPYAAPVTDRQKAICVIWQQLFRIDRVGIHDNFFELGGDSVMALKLLAALESHFKVELPLAEAMNAPTVAEQANSIVEYSETGMDQRKANPLVTFRREGSLPPFFCIHPAGGIVHCYVEMARMLGKDIPFYGMQHPGLDGKTGPYKTYPMMAQLYIEAMREIQPNGPYYIGGWSFGGTLAYEMACQLSAAGEETGMLALFDSPGPSALYRLQGRPEFEFAGMIAFLSQALARMFGGEIELDVDELASIPREDQLDFLVRRMVSTTNQDDLQHAREALERVVDIFELTDRAEQVYQPEPYQGPLYMYRVQEVSDYEYTAYKNHPQIERADFGWGQLCDQMKVRFVPGTHMNMIFPPNIEVLTEKLAEDLRACMQAHSSQVSRHSNTESTCVP